MMVDAMKRIALVLIPLAAACSKDDKPADPPAAKSGDPAAKAPPPAPEEAGPFAAWDMEARRAAFQGAHVTPGGSLGAWEAWNVEGDKVTIWDGSAEKQLDFALLSPCEVKTTEHVGGGSSSTTSHYTLVEGAIVKGLGDAGSRRGPEAIACISNTIFTVDAKGTCTELEASMFDDGTYEAKPATCGFRKDGEREVFFADVRGRETILEVHGDALLSTQLAQTHSEKVADFAAAKAARDARK